MRYQGEDEERMTRKVYKFLKRQTYDNGKDEEVAGIEAKVRYQVNTEVDSGERKITYERMEGRPSVTTHIQGIQTECLLDTGARINVMSLTLLRKFHDVNLIESTITLRCANDSALQVKGKATLQVEIGSRSANIEFIVVEHLNPEMIGGIEFQKQFGIYLGWREELVHKYREDVFSLEAKFGGNTTAEDRLQVAKKTLQIGDHGILYDIVVKYKNVFMAHKWDIGRTDLIKHRIVTKGPPINVKPYRQAMNLEKKIDEAIQNLWDNGIIEQCNSPWNTPLVVVWKKEIDEIRLCLDFRQLNRITERQAFPMPNITEMMDTLDGAKYFSSIDLGNAYYQVELEQESKLKTAFSTKRGQFCFNRMPFGIAAAPGTFQELMSKILGKMEGTCVYLDDILVFSNSKDEHYRKLSEVLDKIEKAGLKINPGKCHFLKEEIKFLGHIVNRKGVKTDPAKTEAIQLFERPKCVKNLRSFLGICNYYRRFIKEYAHKARALEEMCGQKEKKLIWTEKCEKAFQEMKEALGKPPILTFPDFRKSFILDTDASFDTIGAVLSQEGDDGQERVIAYGSKAMNNHEKGYCVTRKELLAVYYFCQHFNHYLYGKKFKLRTDHKALTFMTKTKKPVTAQFQTWINYISSLDVQMEYRKGEQHTNADALSRSSCGTCTQCLMDHESPKSGKIKTRTINTVQEESKIKWQKDDIEITNIRKDINLERSWKFKLIQGVVMTTNDKIWIPQGKREEFIKHIHKSLSHAGAEKTTKYIGCNYDMKDMKETVKKIVYACDACLRVKTITTKTKEDTATIQAKEAFEMIYVDICGPLQESFRKKKYILAIIDQYSKYISLTAISRQDEDTVKATILERWILKFGAPRELHADCGRVFESRALKELMDTMNISIKLSSPYHHNTNGLIERQFRTIRDYINASIKDRSGKDWEGLLPDIEFTLNATFQKTIGRTPAEMVFGRKIFRERWYSTSNDAGGQMNQQTVQTKRNFQVGDTVLVKAEKRTKEEDRFEGPYEITEKVHDRRYRLRNAEGKTVQRNVEKLKKNFL